MLRIVSFFNDILMKERQRWILWGPVGLGIGIYTYFSLRFEPPVWIGIGLILIGFGGFFFARTKEERFAPILFFLCYAFQIIMVGMGLAQVRTLWVHTAFLSEKLPPTSVEGTVIALEKESIHEEKRRFLLCLSSSDAQRLGINIVRVHARFSHDAFQTGRTISATLRLWPVPLPTVWHGYDPQFWAYFEGVDAYGSIKKGTLFEKREKHNSWLVQARSTLTASLRKALPGTSGEVAAALITGEKSGLPEKVRQDFANAGTAHILAISGLHVSLVSGLMFFLIRRGLSLIPSLSDRFLLKKWAALLSIPVIFAYVAISGFGVPSMRALIMTTLVMIGFCLDRNAISLRSLAFAATGLLVIHPECLFSAGFQLSFAAVVALVSFYESYGRVSYRWFIKRRLPSPVIYFLGLCLTTIVATLATTPFTIATFNRFSLHSITGNIVSVPLLGFSVIPLLLLLLPTLAWGAPAWLVFLTDKSIDLMVGYAAWVSHLPGAAITTPIPSTLAMACVIMGGLWWCLWEQLWRHVGAIVCGLGLVIAFIETTTPTLVFSGDGSVILYHRDGKIFSSNLKKNKFFQQVWERALNVSEMHPLQEKVLAFTRGSKTLQVLIDPWTYKEQHQSWQQFMRSYCDYDYVISNGYVARYCKGPAIVWDRQTLQANGGLLVWMQTNDFVIRTFKDLLGKRPWRRWD